MSKLFEPIEIGGMTVKNRVMMAPMGTIADPDGGFSQIVTDYLIERAKGGAGIITTGAVVVTDKFWAPVTGRLHHPAHTARLARLADGVHRYGAKLCLQVTLGNGRCGCNDPNNPPFSASAVPTLQYPDILCKEMPAEDIRYIIGQMGRSTAMAKQAGVDAVMIHAYAGYLLDQFQSAEWNHRQDEYGGSIENRMRFTADIIGSIKNSCGNTYPVLVKFSVHHNTETGRKLEEGLEMCRLLENAGVDAILVDAGSFETQWNRCIPTVYEDEGFSLPVAEQVKRNVSIPVIGQNKLSHPKRAESAIISGQCDMVALGHALLANSQWVNKAESGRIEEIVPCIGCNECFICISSGKTYNCAVNPRLSNEKDPYFLPTPVSMGKRILVIGGGPSGIEAACTAAARGHIVELWEREGRLGGNLNAAGAPSFKKDIINYVTYLEHRINQSGVKVIMGKNACLENIRAGSYDHVILASGATSKTIPLKGKEHVDVFTSLDYLNGSRKPGKHVVILGGGLVGCETAISAAETCKEVTILETLPRILMTGQEARNNSLKLHSMLRERGIRIECNAQVQEVTQEGITFIQTGRQHTIQCDTIILSVGFSPNNELERQLNGASIPVSVVGDALSPRKVLHAVREGMFAALQL